MELLDNLHAALEVKDAEIDAKRRQIEACRKDLHLLKCQRSGLVARIQRVEKDTTRH